MVLSIVPFLAGLGGVIVMSFFLRRSRFLHLPETQMIRALGSIITKKKENALLPGAIAYTIGGIVFAYCYAFFLTTAPDAHGSIMLMVVVCTLIGFVHGLMVTLFLVISVAQYHPIKEFRRLQPEDMAAHVIAHVAYGATVGLLMGWLPKVLGG